MNETPKNVGLGALALIPIVCCVGISLIAAAGLSVAVVAWVSGAVGGAVVLVVVVLTFSVRSRSRA